MEVLHSVSNSWGLEAVQHNSGAKSYAWWTPEHLCPITEPPSPSLHLLPALQTLVLPGRTSSMHSSSCTRCRMRVKPVRTSPPGIACTSLYVPYLRVGNTKHQPTHSVT